MKNIQSYNPKHRQNTQTIHTHLHLRAQHSVVTCQLRTVDGVHHVRRRSDLPLWRPRHRLVLCSSGGVCDRGVGGAVQLEQSLDIGAVLVGQGLLVLVCPLADLRLPALDRKSVV